MLARSVQKLRMADSSLLAPLRLVSLLLFAFLLAGCVRLDGAAPSPTGVAPPMGGPGTILGRVQDLNGPVRGAYVSLYYGQEGLNEMQDTDAGGWYIFTERLPYSHRVVVQKTGYAAAQATVTPHVSHAVWLNFTLQPK